MTMARYLRPLAAALFVVSLLPGVALASDGDDALLGKYDAFFVFGDSLADVGNVWLTSKVLRVSPAPPPSQSPNRTYFNGRFSNGPIAFEYLWQRISGAAPGTSGALKPYIASPIFGSKAAVDFAFGGTGTPLLDQTPGGLYAPGLRGQVELFRLGLGGKVPSKKALYAIVTGANDYRADVYNVPMAPTDVVANIAASIERLYATGARDLLVLTLPDLGLLPYLSPEQAAQGSLVTAAHNQLLATAVGALSAKYPDIRLRLADVNEVFDTLRAGMNAQVPAIDVLLPPLDPNTEPPTPMSACLFVAPSACADVPSSALGADAVIVPGAPEADFLFWDVVHPTTDAHRALGDFLAAQLVP